MSSRSYTKAHLFLQPPLRFLHVLCHRILPQELITFVRIEALHILEEGGLEHVLIHHPRHRRARVRAGGGGVGVAVSCGACRVLVGEDGPRNNAHGSSTSFAALQKKKREIYKATGNLQ